MGGLWNKVPVTFITMTAAVLAIAGFPPLAGFFSKDSILYAAFLHGTEGKILWFVGLVTALLTSLYMFRLWYLTFLGKPRSEAHPHESPLSMLIPLILLAALSICGGWIGIGRFSAFLKPAAGPMPNHAVPVAPQLEIVLTALAVLVAFLGWFIADRLYRQKPERPAQLATTLAGPYNLLLNKYYVDELYNAVIVKPLLGFSKYFLVWVVDGGIIGGVTWLLAGIPLLSGAILQRWQSGNLRSYAAWLAAGAALLLFFVLFASHSFDFAVAIHWARH